MSRIKEWFLLVIGIGLVAVAVQGIFRGWLPNGKKGFKQGEGGLPGEPARWILVLLRAVLWRWSARGV